jgi:hypothetical protein
MYVYNIYIYIIYIYDIYNMGGGLGMWKRRREGKLKHEGEGEEGAAAGEERDLELVCQKKK